MSVVIEQRIATLLGNLGLVPFFVLALLGLALERTGRGAGRAGTGRLRLGDPVLSRRGALGPGAGQPGPQQGPELEPDIVIEHMHPTAGKGQWDDSYPANNSGATYQADSEAYGLWVRTDMEHDVARLREIIAR